MQRKLSRNRRKYSQLQAYQQQQQCSFSQIFVQADEYPTFFKQNLVDDDRTIKIFYNQPYAHQTIFYFQLFKLIYQTEDLDYEKYLAKIYDLLDNPEFEFVIPQEDNYYFLGVGEVRIRKMMQQFLDQLGQGKMRVTDMIAKYPIIDKIMILFLRTILIIAEKCQAFHQYIEATEIYEFFAEYFQIQITYYTNCLRFNQSDFFVYFQAQNEIYLAFITPKASQEHIMSSSQFYQADPQEAFNISSVKQMVSEIDIPIQEECFTLSKYNQTLNQTEYIDYDYSQSQEAKQPSRSIHQNSQLKFSHLIGDESSLLQNMNVIKSNKVLQKEIIGQKRVYTIQAGKNGWKNMDCFAIKQAPLQLQNAISPAATPKCSRFASFGKGDASFEKQNYNIYQKRKNKGSKVSDTIRQEFQLLSTVQSEGSCAFKSVKQKNNLQVLKKQTQKVLFNEPTMYIQQPQKTLKSLYQMRSIKSIISCNDSESYVLDTPIKTSYNHSRKQTVQGWNGKKNQYTRFGYVNNNISNEFTSSILLKQMNQPFKVKIESMKKKARLERKNIQNMIYF